jgi:hypothetical protein
MKRIICTFNGTRTQARDLVKAIKVDIAKKERAKKMAKWFNKVKK